MRLLFLLAIAMAGYLIYKLYFQQLLKQGKAGKIKIGLIVVGLCFLALAATGRAHVLFGIIGALMTQVMRFIPLIIKFAPFLQKYLAPGTMGTGGLGGANSNGSGQSSVSKVTTQSLVMTLNHETGAINGEILQGSFANRLLSELNNAELQLFYDYCQQNDSDTLRLLDAYIARERGEWEEAPHSEQSKPANTSDDISQREAYDILGLEPGATKDDVVSAHRALMSQLHPDKGGSNYLAAKVNEAKKILLKNLS